MKILKNIDNGKMSVLVTKIDQQIQIISERPLNIGEDITTFHPSISPQITTNISDLSQNNNTPFQGTYTKNVGSFNISVTRKYR